MNFSRFVFLFFLYSQLSFCQNNSVIPKGFRKLEGIEYTGKTTFYIEEKTQTILALKNNKVDWKVDAKYVCGKRYVAKSKMKYIGIRGKHLEIVYKERTVIIIIETGQTECSEKIGRTPIY